MTEKKPQSWEIQPDMPELRIEKIYHTDPYIICDRSKGHSKKHIAVCKRCRWNKKCKPYQRYWQPELPLVFINP